MPDYKANAKKTPTALLFAIRIVLNFGGERPGRKKFPAVGCKLLS
jgi:hypothetical protein